MKKQNNCHFISIIMPVYNAGDFLVESIESILNQTYKEYEFIIVDDASTDSSWEMLKRYAKKDPRIKLLRNKTNEGVSITVKRAIKEAQGDFLARMDADDISMPDRIEKQVKYLQDNPDVVALGTQCETIDTEGAITGEKVFPTEFEKIHRYIFTFIPVQQPSLMIARNRLPRNFEFYHDGMNTAEEVELLFKLFQYGKVVNLPEKLLKYRLHGNNTSMRNIRQTFYLTLLSRIKAVVKYGYRPHMSDIFMNIAQLIAITILPQKACYFLYTHIRKIAQNKRSYNLNSVHPTITPAYTKE